MDKYKYNIKQAVVMYNGEVFHLSNMDGITTVLDNGKRISQTRREFNSFVKSFEKYEFLVPLKFGEYVNVNTGKVENLYGID